MNIHESWCVPFVTPLRGRVGEVPAPTAAGLVDAVDDRNERVGTVPRRDVFTAGTNFRTVHVLVFDDAGALLLQRLAGERDRHPLRWGSSVAGYLHAGEDYASAARRRLQEELSLTTPLRQVGITAMPDDGVTKFIGVFITRSNTARIGEPQHIAALRYWPRDQLGARLQREPELFTPSLLHVLDYVSHEERAGT